MKIPEVIQHIESSNFYFFFFVRIIFFFSKKIYFLLKNYLDKGRKKLEEFSIKVLDAIVENLDSMPFGIRYLSKQMIL